MSPLGALLDEAQRDDSVVGPVVFGSRGKGALVTEGAWPHWSATPRRSPAGEAPAP